MMQMAVDSHLFPGFPAKQIVDGDTQPLSFNIPKRHIDPGDGAHHHLTRRPEGAAHDFRPAMLDPARVLTDQQLLRSGR